MKKQEDKKDILKEWIDEIGHDRAPEGFTAKMMARVEVEPATVELPARMIFGKGFAFYAVAVIILLISMALLLQGASDPGWITFITSKAEGLGLNSISLPDLGRGLFDGKLTFLYKIIPSILLLLLLEMFVSRRLVKRK